MRCRDVELELLSRGDGADGPLLSAGALEHCSQCDACRRALTIAKLLREAQGNGAMDVVPPVPSSLQESIMASVRMEAASRSTSVSTLVWRPRKMRLAFYVAAVLAVAVAGVTGAGLAVKLQPEPAVAPHSDVQMAPQVAPTFEADAEDLPFSWYVTEIAASAPHGGPAVLPGSGVLR